MSTDWDSFCVCDLTCHLALREAVLVRVDLHPSCCSRCPGCFYKYRPDIINPTFHCAAFLRVALPYQMLSFYGAERASKALYDFKSVVKYFQEAHIKEISSCDRLCWLCKGTKHKEQVCFSAYLLSKGFTELCVPGWVQGF